MLVRNKICLTILPFLILFIIIYLGKLYIKRNLHETFVSIKLTEEEKDLINSEYDTNNIEKYNKLMKRHGLIPSFHAEKNFCELIGLYNKSCENNLSYASK